MQRIASYIRTDKVVSLGERLLPLHGTLAERYHAIDERYQGEVGILVKRYQGESRESLLSQMPNDIQGRIELVGKRVPKDPLNQLVVDMCAVRPLGMDELSLLLHRNAKS